MEVRWSEKYLKMNMVDYYPIFSLVVVSMLLVSGSAEGESTAVELPKAAREFLEAHNEARAAVGVEPLNWSGKLANATSLLVRYQRNNMSCQFANLTAGKYGGNQLWASGMTVTPRMAVEEWVKEKNYYNHTDNTCVPNHSCGVYTQVVWRKSLELGCAQATCVKDQTTLTICFYNPPGNVIGQSPY